MAVVADEVALLRADRGGHEKARMVAGSANFAAGRLGRRYLREPFFHFLVLGAALFYFSHWLEERGRFTRIEVTKDIVRGLAQNYHLQYGRDPVPQQLDALVEGYIREEVLYHEALKLGLDQDDEIVRRRLVQKYEFLQQDLAIAAEPSGSDLRTYFASHGARYQSPDMAAFTQVYFSADRHGEVEARNATQRAANQLNGAGLTRAADTGDAFPGPADYPALSAEEAERVFGRSQLTLDLFHLKPGHWSEPLRSAYGWHTVYIDSYTPAHAAIFSQVADRVRRDYLEDARVSSNEASFAQLRKRFEIVRE